jgi:hypothetical protein
MNINQRVIYVGDKNLWTFYRDLLLGFRGKITEIIKTPKSINYMVEFENGLHISIDQIDLKPLD